MKKQLGIVLAAALLAGSVVGCSSKPAETTAAPTTVAETTTAAATTAAETTAAATTEAAKAEGGLKVGLSVITSLGSSKDAGEKDGNAQVDAVGVAVIVDADGKIVNCVIDTAQNKMGFTKEGKIVPTEEFKTKKELKEAYNMKPASAIGKEWYEQAAALEQYVIGKTADEVKGIAVDADTKTTEADLAASCSMKIGSYINAIADAATNAQETGTQAGDKLGLGVVTDMLHSSKDAGEKDGLAQSDSTFAAVTVGADGKTTAVVIDCVQGKVNFDATGVIKSDLKAEVKTKKQLGAEYNMKPASPIGKEWFEQAAAFEAFTTGKTADEITGIAVDEDNKTTDADLVTSCTMSIGDLQKAVVKAIANVQ